MLAECLTGVVSQLLCRTADGRGRVAALEVLLHTEALPNTIREGQMGNILTMIEGGAAEGMCTMDASLRRLVGDGAITPMEAYMKATNKDEFEKLLPAADKASGKS